MVAGHPLTPRARRADRRQAGEVVPPRGFEPVISTLKGWRPRPLDDGDADPPIVARRPRAPSAWPYRHKRITRITAPERASAASRIMNPPPSAIATDIPVDRVR